MGDYTVDSIRIMMDAMATDMAKDIAIKLDESIMADIVSRNKKIALANILIKGLEPYLQSHGTKVVIWYVPVEKMKLEFNSFDFSVLDIVFNSTTLVTVGDEVIISAFYEDAR